MAEYLSIIRKSDFVDLFKYGHLYVFNAIPFDGCFSSHAEDKDLFDALTKYQNNYEYSFTYMLIHFESKDENEREPIQVFIEDVCGVYTFDEDAKKEMSLTFDPRINIQVSPWTKLFEGLKQKMFFNQSIQGVRNLWQLFKLTQEDLATCENKITKEVVDQFVNTLFDNKQPEGKHSLWLYLLRYERHAIYPMDKRGYACDMVHSVYNCLNGTTVPDEIVKKSNIYNALKAVDNSKASFTHIAPLIDENPISEKTRDLTGVDYPRVAILFLYLKDLYGEGITKFPDKKEVEAWRKFVGESFPLAIYLLGLTLGHEKTLDAFYDNIGLTIFKKSDSSSDDIQNIETMHKHEDPSPGEILLMYKGDRLDRNATITLVHSEKEQREKEEMSFSVIAKNQMRNACVKNYIKVNNLNLENIKNIKK